MVNLKQRFASALFLVAACLCSTGAMAATVIGTLNSVGAGDSITLHAVRPNGTTFGVQALAGISTFTRTGGTDTAQLAGGANTFFAFCLEPYEDAYLNATYSYTVDPLASGAKSSLAATGGIGVLKATQISELFGLFAPDLAAPMTMLQASALQVATWEIASELSTNPLSVFAGNTWFSTPGSADAEDVKNLAQSYLNAVTSANGNGPRAQGLEALTVNGNQDMLVQVVSAAPEPGTWLMMFVGFGLVGHTMRARCGKNAKTRPIMG